MKQLMLLFVVLIAPITTVESQTPKAERLKVIRTAYAQAKKKIEQNGKNGKSPKDMRIVLNRLEDEDIGLYDMETLDYYFDETVTEKGVVSKQPYFIVENWSNHGHLRYSEILINPANQQVMFCYMRGETDGGFVVESRYYYDTQGRCIEQKHNTDNSWTDADGEKKSAEYFLKLFNMATHSSPAASSSPSGRPGGRSTTPKAQRMQHIRSTYAKAKEKIALNDKKELSDDLKITIHDMGDDRPPCTTLINMYFDDGCYFINYHTKSMMADIYYEYLFEPKSEDLIFSYCRSREEGEENEWRYYFDENGRCIETKSSSEDTDGGIYDLSTAKDLQLLFRTITSDEVR